MTQPLQTTAYSLESRVSRDNFRVFFLKEKKDKETFHKRFPLIFLFLVFLQGVESVFDIMDLEDEERNKLLRLDDNQIQVSKDAL